MPLDSVDWETISLATIIPDNYFANMIYDFCQKYNYAGLYAEEVHWEYNIKYTEQNCFS